MTSPVDFMTQGWAMFSRGADIDASDRMYDLLKTYGIRPKEFFTYGENKTFLESQMVNSSDTVAFHRGHLIGTYEQVKTYLLLRDPDETSIG